MKKIILITIVLLLSVNGIKGQGREWGGQGPMKKIENLEKIKLLEVLKLDETTTLKFFSRRAEFKEKKHQLIETSNKLIEEIEETVKSGKSNEESLKKLINAYLLNLEKIDQNKREFIKSVSDILTTEQIAKMIVFEKRFRDEIRRVLMRARVGRVKN